jgi:hypothetical protein
MKITAAILLMMCFVGEVLGGEPRLLLVPQEASIKSGRNVKFDVYLCNDTKQPKMVPPLTVISTNYVFRDNTGVGLRFRSSTVRPMHTLTGHILQPNAFDHATVMLDVLAEPGDLAEIYIEVKGTRILRSNTIQLFCPPKNGK